MLVSTLSRKKFLSWLIEDEFLHVVICRSDGTYNRLPILEGKNWTTVATYYFTSCFRHCLERSIILELTQDKFCTWLFAPLTGHIIIWYFWGKKSKLFLTRMTSQQYKFFSAKSTYYQRRILCKQACTIHHWLNISIEYKIWTRRYMKEGINVCDNYF